MAKNRLTKIVYFDEQTALDYVEIRDQGHYLREVEREYEGKTGVDTKASAKTPKLLSTIFRLSADIHASAEAKRIVKSTVSNTILTDFIDKADKDTSVERLTGYDIKLTEETRLTIYTAITDAANGNIPMDQQGTGIELSKFGSVLKNLQGYLECHAVKDGEVNAILRFNSESFRNNYRLADIINMDLHYYGVKVGKTSASTMKSLGLDLTNKTSDPRNEINRLLESPHIDTSEKELDVYDIILAGVFDNAAE
jgi:hypothetical protein